MAKLLPEHEKITVRLQTFPALRMLGGHIDRVAIDVERPDLAGHHLAWLALRGEQVQVDAPSLLEGKLHVKRADLLRLEVSLDEEQLSRYVAEQLPTVASLRVRLQQGRLQVHGAVPILGQSLQVSAIGRLLPVGVAGVRFLPEEIAIEGEKLPEFIYPALDSLLRWELDLSRLPVPVRIDSIAVTEEFLVIQGVWETAESVV